MKKLLTLLVLLVTAVPWCWADTFYDVISWTAVKQSSQLKEYDKSNMSTITSDTKYMRYGNISSGSNNWYFQSGVTGVIANSTSVGTIKSVTIKAYSNYNFNPVIKIYGSDAPITQSNYASATQIDNDVKVTHQSSTKAEDNPFVVPVDGSYEYVAIVVTTRPNYCYFRDITFEWETAAADPAPTPVFTPAESTTPVSVGQNINITAEGASIAYQYAVADAETENPSYNGTDLTELPFEVPMGASGRWLYIKATASGDGMTPTEAVWHNQVAEKAKEPAAVPTFDPAADSEAKIYAGDVVRVTPVSPETKIQYWTATAENKLADGEEPAEWIEGSSYGVDQPANYMVDRNAAGKWLYIKAIATGDNYLDSEETIWCKQVEALTKAETPTFSAPNPLVEGAEIIITSTSEAAEIYYRYATSAEATETPEYGDWNYSQTSTALFAIPSGSEGKYLYVEAYTGGARYEDSENNTWSGLIQVCPVDVFKKADITGTDLTLTGSSSELPYSAKNLYAHGISYFPWLGIGDDSNIGILANTSNDKGLLVNYVSYSASDVTTPVNVYVSNEPITLDNYTSAVLVGSISKGDLTKKVTEGEYKYVALVSGNAETNWTTAINIAWKPAPTEEPAPEFKAVPYSDGKTSAITLDNTEVNNPDPETGWVRYAWTISGVCNQENYQVDFTLPGYDWVAYAAMADVAGSASLKAMRRAVSLDFNMDFEAISTALTEAGYTVMGQQKLNADGFVTLSLPTPNYKQPSVDPLAEDGPVAGSEKIYALLPGKNNSTNDGGLYNPNAMLGLQSTVTYSEQVGVIGIEAEGAEAEYYTLQGVRVANPENGIYVKVVNGKASKVLVK